jgi:RNAse (barnase) inhibitor barstar
MRHEAMSVITSRFVFNLTEIGLDVAEDFVARIPPGLTTRAQLFGVLRRELRLPNYFGENWDALSDCLRDLSWIRSHRVILVHEDLPRLDCESRAEYVDILQEAIHDWKPGENHELIVVFPQECLDTIASVLEKSE